MSLTIIILLICQFLLFLTTLGIFIILPKHTILLGSSLSLFLIISGILLITQKDKIKKYLKTSHFFNLSSNLIRLSLLFLILMVINYIVFLHPYSFDTTKQKVNTLSSQTAFVLKELKGDLNFKIFLRRDNWPYVKKLFELYRMEKSNISTEFIDPDLHPEIIKDYDIRHHGSVYITYNKKSLNIIGIDEKSITGGLIKISRSRDPVIYFIEGHGELSLENESDNGLTLIKENLEKEYYQVRPLFLPKLSSIPKDASSIVLLQPTQAYSDQEMIILRNYLNDGGHVLVAMGPELTKNPILKNLRNLFSDYGILWNNHLVIDTAYFINGSKGMAPIIKNINHHHPITEKFFDQLFFPVTTSLWPLKLNENKEKFKITNLLLSSPFPYSWSEKNLEKIAKEKFDFEENNFNNQKGPLVLGISVETENKDAVKIVALGNAYFITNLYKQFPGNFLFFLNSINWLADEDFLISDGKLSLEKSAISILNEWQLNVIFYFSVIFCPIILICLSLGVYLKRRKA